ncbi:ABC-type transport auxiliary lipoprotein family protein [Sinorhizobium terangae]|uniref:ABC transporter n=1 Tax=Sinorhizobium terangae TaxID=110322 RepID=A0A6N7LIF4_SINTE|nr:ABC-type transport auxiliary lipoprotein family protein [Sinorhizobium terangae]MBB4187515.1 cholesterol transport system auxiliary component [Sinorhizobium terangae]MQX16978.1 ABC transporter [Sinorhizobium terangae]WFU49279.1 ABC-type transport auxiliary lipoprotein family protein [Sinorhizobium terangae]
MDFRGLVVVRKGRATRSAVIFSLAMALAGCGTRAAVNDTFSLATAPIVKGQASTNRQILVPEPTALQTINNDRIVIRLSRSELQFLAKAQWGDRLPRMVQDKLVQTFDNTGNVKGVGKPGQGLAIDYQLITEIRSFEVSTEGADTAVVEIYAKLLNDRDGTVLTQKDFRAAVPARAPNSPAFVAALDAAFAQVAADIVSWTLSSI